MSVIACKIYDNGYDIASDSISVRGWTQTRGDNLKESKLFEVDGIVVGGVGYAESINLFRLFLNTHRPENSGESALLELLSEFCDWKYAKINNSKLEASFIIAIQNNVFSVEGWDINKVNTYMAIGAGMDFALSALYLGHGVEKAVETAIELSVYCENPINKISKRF